MIFVQSMSADNKLLVEASNTNGNFSTPEFAFNRSVATPGVTAGYLMVETDKVPFSTATKMKIYSVLEFDKTNIDYI